MCRGDFMAPLSGTSFSPLSYPKFTRFISPDLFHSVLKIRAFFILTILWVSILSDLTKLDQIFIGIINDNFYCQTKHSQNHYVFNYVILNYTEYQWNSIWVRVQVGPQNLHN